MKKFITAAIIVIMFLVPLAINVSSSATPCTDAWSECIAIHGYPDEGCDYMWEFCMDMLYGR